MPLPPPPPPQLDLVPRLQGHDRLLPARSPALVAAHPLELALEGRGPDRGDLHVEHGLDRDANLDLVGVGAHPERDRVQLVLLPHALLGHERPDQDLARRPAHRASASSSATRPARSNTTRCAASSWWTETWPGVTTSSHGTLRAARASTGPSSRTTSSAGAPVRPSEPSSFTSAFVRAPSPTP